MMIKTYIKGCLSVLTCIILLACNDGEFTKPAVNKTDYEPAFNYPLYLYTDSDTTQMSMLSHTSCYLQAVPLEQGEQNIRIGNLNQNTNFMLPGFG